MNRRLTRNEAITMLYGGVHTLPLALDYPGGWRQILADALCLDEAYIRKTIVYQTRRDSPLFERPGRSHAKKDNAGVEKDTASA